MWTIIAFKKGLLRLSKQQEQNVISFQVNGYVIVNSIDLLTGYSKRLLKIFSQARKQQEPKLLPKLVVILMIVVEIDWCPRSFVDMW